MKYLNKLLISIILVFFMACSNKNSVNNIISLQKDWKFKIGDDINWAKPDLDDSKWDSISIAKIWKNQDDDGFAWYRIKVIIPSSLKDNSYLKDSLQIRLGKIDDGDQLYINGKFIGQNTNKIFDV